MPDKFGTLLARFIVRHLHRPSPLVVAGWLLQAAEADEPDEKRRCLKPVLGLDPDNSRAPLALLALARQME